MVLRRVNGSLFYGCTGYPECVVTHGAKKDGMPVGIPGDARTRAARQRAHESFDRLWLNAPELYALPEDPAEKVAAIRKIRGVSRSRAYRWLAARLEMAEEECHIGRMDAFTCELVAKVCRSATPGDVRTWWKFNRKKLIKNPEKGASE